MNRALEHWLTAHTAHAPPVLRERVFLHARLPTHPPTVAEALASASRRALQAVALAPEGGRAIALDLLAADALITLALLAHSEMAPQDLEAFATTLLREPVAAP